MAQIDKFPGVSGRLGARENVGICSNDTLGIMMARLQGQIDAGSAGSYATYALAVAALLAGSIGVDSQIFVAADETNGGAPAWYIARSRADDFTMSINALTSDYRAMGLELQMLQRPLLPVPVITNATATLTTEQIAAQWRIAGGYFTAANQGLRLGVSTQTAAASVLTYRVRVGPAGTTADTSVIVFTDTAAQASNAFQALMADLMATAVGGSGAIQGAGLVSAQGAIVGPVNGSLTPVTVNTAAPIYVTVTVSESSAAGVVTVVSATLSASG